MATKTKSRLNHIEANQGVGHRGKVYGYDHKRSNYITWDFVDGRIVAVKVEHDDSEEEHGSLSATLRDARSVAARENRLPGSRLRMAMERGFQRN